LIFPNGLWFIAAERLIDIGKGVITRRLFV
jgi:hypothetical protein